ncbi:MAG: hypothetical protein LBV41_02710 [Cytophagaceae bacterium]|jgi:hypothetical protein|nr:hypothetical protein [Cytophagaceae bacterium]
MSESSSFHYYCTKSDEFKHEMRHIEQKAFRLYLLRIVTFVGFIALLITFVLSGYNSLCLTGSIALFLLFMSIVQMDFRLSCKRRLVAAKIQIANNELKYINHKYDEFDGGKHYSAINPHLAGDFDIFGNGSLYQYINRCVTGFGSKLLAERLSHPTKETNIIVERQKAIVELAEKPIFITDFRAAALAADSEPDDVAGFNRWLNEPSINIKTLRVVSLIYPILFFIQIILVALSVLPASTLCISFAFAFYIVFQYKKQIDKAHCELGKSGAMFRKYAALIRVIEKETFRSPLLQSLYARLQNGNEKASSAVASLYKLVDRFDLRNNMIIAILFNLVFLFDLHIYYQLCRWRLKHRDVVSDWFNVLAEIDVINGFACFAFNCSKETVYPHISDDEIVFDADELGHPLIPSATRVGNTIRFGGKPSATVITGANMAGKSTFLRTVAVNLILAMNGSPVCARKLVFKPCSIMSSINIRDSLKQKASYFYAELVRIKEIITHAEEHPDTLVILDEILRGTNTKDKQTGSIGLLEKLISLNANVMIATHDLAIGELAVKYPHIVANHCFEVELEDDRLVFDYKLKSGVSKKLNASFLMKRMGIIE